MMDSESFQKISTPFFRRDRRLNFFQKIVWLLGLILKLRDVEIG